MDLSLFIDSFEITTLITDVRSKGITRAKSKLA